MLLLVLRPPPPPPQLLLLRTLLLPDLPAHHCSGPLPHCTSARLKKTPVIPRKNADWHILLTELMHHARVLCLQLFSYFLPVILSPVQLICTPGDGIGDAL